MPLPSPNLIISDFTFLVRTNPGCPGKEAVKRVLVVVVVVVVENDKKAFYVIHRVK